MCYLLAWKTENKLLISMKLPVHNGVWVCGCRWNQSDFSSHSIHSFIVTLLSSVCCVVVFILSSPPFESEIPDTSLSVSVALPALGGRWHTEWVAHRVGAQQMLLEYIAEFRGQGVDDRKPIPF